MRPTLLQFRSPKEQTPDPNYPKVTKDGRRLAFKTMHKSASASTFTSAKRFTNYKAHAKRTGVMVGPGSYNAEKYVSPGQTRWHLEIGKPYHSDQYMYDGNHLVANARSINSRSNATYQFRPFSSQNSIKEDDKPVTEKMIERIRRKLKQKYNI